MVWQAFTQVTNSISDWYNLRGSHFTCGVSHLLSHRGLPTAEEHDELFGGGGGDGGSFPLLPNLFWPRSCEKQTPSSAQPMLFENRFWEKMGLKNTEGEIFGSKVHINFAFSFFLYILSSQVFKTRNWKYLKNKITFLRCKFSNFLT